MNSIFIGCTTISASSFAWETLRLSRILEFAKIVQAASLIPNLYYGLLCNVLRHRQNVDIEGFYCSEHNLLLYNLSSVRF